MGKTYESLPAEGTGTTGAAHPAAASAHAAETAGLLPSEVTVSVLSLREAVSVAGDSAREVVHVQPATAAHPAEAAHAHHLVRNAVDLLTFDDHCASSKSDASVDVEAGIASDVNGSAGDGEVSVGIDAVRIPDGRVVSEIQVALMRSSPA